jgi:pimeloyl-ACP methyl ester carboxylesterase
MKLFIVSMLLLLFTAGCNFVRLKERLVARSIQKSGLVRKEVQLGVDRVGYWEGGKGPTLVMLHGFGADGTLGWNQQIPELAKYFKLVVPDLLWFGRSSSFKADYSVEHQAVALKNLLAYLGVKQFNLMGLSYGGIIALHLFEDCPGQVERLIVVDSPGPVYTREDYRKVLKRYHVKSASELVMPTDSKGLDRLFQIAYANPPYVPFFARPQVVDFVKDLPTGERTALLHKALDDLEYLKKKIKSPQIPVLIIWGSEDPLFPVEIAARLKEHWGEQATLEVIQGGRHTPNMDFSGEFNQLVVDFLKP